MTIKNIVFLSSIMAISSFHITSTPVATTKAKAPTSLAHSQNTIKTSIQQAVKLEARKKGISVQKLLATKTKLTATPIAINQPKTTIKAAAAKAAVAAKQKAKTAKVATAKLATAVQK